MGTGEMEGEGRALRAAEAAISNPLLDDVSMKGARAVLVNVTGGPDLMLFEVDEAVNRIRAEVDPRRQHPLRQRAARRHGRPHARLGRRHRHRCRDPAPDMSPRMCSVCIRRAADDRPRPKPPRPRAAPARMSSETSTVSRMMDNLAVQLDTLSDDGAPSRSPRESPRRDSGAAAKGADGRAARSRRR